MLNLRFVMFRWAYFLFNHTFKAMFLIHFQYVLNDSES